MVMTLVPLVLLACLGAPPAPPSGPMTPMTPQDRGGDTQSEHVRNGARHFERAFYELTPHKRDAEATREFDLAIAAFEAELRARPSSLEPRRYLGRIFTLRKQFRRAARQYDELSGLDPSDVDARLLAAAAWADAGEFGQARARLLEAKEHTTDPQALFRLDECLARLDGRRPVPPS